MTPTSLLYVFVAFFAGYVVARLDSIYAVLTKKAGADGGTFLMAATAPPARGVRQQQEQAAAEARIAQVSIDTTTVVTPVKTDDIKKSADVALGSVTKQSDTLDSSVSKLAQLKR